MTPDQVLEKLQGLGIAVSSVTLHHYVKWGLLEPPETKSMGRHQGRVTNYSDNAPANIYAAYMLLHGRYRLAKDYAREIVQTGGEILYNLIGNNMQLITEQHQKNMAEKQAGLAAHARTHLYFPADRFVLQWISDLLMASKEDFHENLGLIYLLGNENIIGVEKTVPRRNQHFHHVSILFRHIDFPSVYLQLLETGDYNRKFPPRQN